MLKLLLDSLEGVDESLHSFYEKQDDGYHLKVEGVEDTGALKRAKDREKAEKKAAESRARELEDELKAIKKQLDDDKRNNARDKGDVEALEKSWQEKYDKLQSELTAERDTLQSNLTTMLVDSKAEAIASELAVQGSAPALIPHIKARLAAEQRDGKYTTVVLGDDGKASALTLDELKAEITGNAAFAPLIAGSKASGSGASGGDHSGGAAKTGDLGGSREDRVKAIAARFPDLEKAS